MSQENVDAIRAGFALWNLAVGDTSPMRRREALEEMAAVYHPEAEIDFSRTTPDYAATRGPAGMLAWMAAAQELFEQVQIEATDLIDAGDTVVAAVSVTGTGTSSRVPVALEYAYAFRFRDRQVVSATSYSTLEQARQAVGLSSEPEAMSANVDLVRSIYATVGSGDYSSAAWASRDIEYVVADGVEPATARGLEELAQTMRRAFSVMETWRDEPELFREVDATRVLVLGRFRGRGRASGLEVHQQVAQVFEIHAGKVTRIVVYFDRARAFDDLGLEA
ncbi:MAG TPA: nuclear transport factor 2 family protein [Solirubrobacteraceae bacterium]|jgi:ketosteroid isomerase-like protein